MTDQTTRPQMGDFDLGLFEYYIENPSAWEQGFDQRISDMMRDARSEILRLRASLPQPTGAGEVLTRLKHAKITEVNDDVSEPDSEKRARHVWRVEAMADTIEFLEGLASTPAQSVLVEALREMVYETTHLSPCEDDGSHKCRITGQTLAKARAALSHAPSQPAPVVAGWKLVPDIGTEVNVRAHPQGPFKVFERKIDEFSPHAICVRGNDTAWFNINMLSASPQPDRESEITTAMVQRAYAWSLLQDAVPHEMDYVRGLLTAALTSSNRPQATEEGK